jgi:redox-sensitive bicupin YhaK (pirin superfamily)
MSIEIVLDGKTNDVRPHPHLGLSTFTCLFEGARER